MNEIPSSWSLFHCNQITAQVTNGFESISNRFSLSSIQPDSFVSPSSHSNLRACSSYFLKVLCDRAIWLTYSMILTSSFKSIDSSSEETSSPPSSSLMFLIMIWILPTSVRSRSLASWPYKRRPFTISSLMRSDFYDLSDWLPGSLACSG